MDDLVSLVLLFRPLSTVVVPGVGDLLPEPAFPLPDVAYYRAVIGAAPAACRTGAGQSPLLAAITLEGDVSWMPLVNFAERDLAGLVVRFGALGDPRHSLTPFGRPCGRPMKSARRL